MFIVESIIDNANEKLDRTNKRIKNKLNDGEKKTNRSEKSKAASLGNFNDGKMWNFAFLFLQDIYTKTVEYEKTWFVQ